MQAARHGSLLRVTFGIALMLAFVVGIAANNSSATADVTPPEVNVELEPGESITVDKTVSIPESTPKLDLFMIVDLSGSYGNDLPNIKAVDEGLVAAIRADIPDSNFGLGSFKDFPISPWGGFSSAGYNLSDSDQNGACWFIFTTPTDILVDAAVTFTHVAFMAALPLIAIRDSPL